MGKTGAILYNVYILYIIILYNIRVAPKTAAGLRLFAAVDEETLKKNIERSGEKLRTGSETMKAGKGLGEGIYPEDFRSGKVRLKNNACFFKEYIIYY